MVTGCVLCEVRAEVEEATQHRSYNTECVLYEVGD
jgi:hypothetical protein